MKNEDYIALAKAAMSGDRDRARSLILCASANLGNGGKSDMAKRLKAIAEKNPGAELIQIARCGSIAD